MNDLSTVPTPALHAMKDRLTNWLVGILAFDLLLIAGFVVVLLTKSPRHAMPLAPVLMVPALALVPFLRRIGSVKKELAQRRVRGG
jgi:bacteriorhodopsin